MGKNLASMLWSGPIGFTWVRDILIPLRHRILLESYRWSHPLVACYICCCLAFLAQVEESGSSSPAPETATLDVDSSKNFFPYPMWHLIRSFFRSFDCFIPCHSAQVRRIGGRMRVSMPILMVLSFPARESSASQRTQSHAVRLPINRAGRDCRKGKDGKGREGKKGGRETIKGCLRISQWISLPR